MTGPAARRAEAEPVRPVADGKDWTWVTERACPECGFDPRTLRREDIGAVLRETATRWATVLDSGEVRTRPAPAVWSPLEYGCHCRDVYLLFFQRAAMMLDQLDPVFENWDQDSTAVQNRYWETDPVQVIAQIETAAGASADLFAGVRKEQWPRTGRRSNGSVFTVESLGRYFVHDIVHHLSDVGAAPAR